MARPGHDDLDVGKAVSCEVRPCGSAEELRAVLQPITHYFGRARPTDDFVDAVTRLLSPERAYGAWDGGRVVGGAGAFPFTLTVPGGRIRAAGVTLVGVLPTHRRRGILRAMMRAQLEACHARGESVAYLWASEDRIYGRFGYGVASFSADIEVPRERTAYHPWFTTGGYAAALVPLAEAEDLVAPVFERVARETPGMFARSSAWWQARALVDAEWRRAGRGELQCVVLERAGLPAAYALYRVTPGFDRGVQTGAVDVVEAMGDSSEATAAVWRYLLDLDLLARVRATLLPVDHPLLLLLAEPRRLRFSFRDGLWVRLVDVGAALAARTYAAGDAVVVQITDDFCPWNAGRWRIGGGGVARTDAAADLLCDVTALGSVYLGGFTWAQLARALRVEEARKGGLARADALCAAERAPWCPEIF
jgi:predicted acetyltransferase